MQSEWSIVETGLYPVKEQNAPCFVLANVFKFSLSCLIGDGCVCVPVCACVCESPAVRVCFILISILFILPNMKLCCQGMWPCVGPGQVVINMTTHSQRMLHFSFCNQASHLVCFDEGVQHRERESEHKVWRQGE